MRKHCGSVGAAKRSRCVSAVLAFGLTAATAWADQALDPVNVTGTPTTAPAAAVPANAPPPTTPVAPVAADTDSPVPGSGPIAAGASDTPGAATQAGDAPPIPSPPARGTPEAVPVTGTTPPGAVVPPTTAAADTQPVPDLTKDTTAYPITGLKVNYYKESPNQPPIERLLNTTVRLGIANDGYTSPAAGTQVVTIRLGDIGQKGITRIYRSGIETVYAQVVRFFNQQGIIGVFVVVDAKDIDQNDRDIRGDRTTLQLIVVTSRVRQIRTLAATDTRGEDRVNLPRHAKIKERSPLQADGTPDGRMDMLNKDVLDNYVLRLNRQPGRRVDVAISGTDTTGEINLDYLVSETRPWYAYAQISNTGTRQTDPWRERFGFVHNQLTRNDDVLSIDYLTAAFSQSHALVGSYELPVFNFDRLRYKIFATYNEFTASDVGQNQERFNGEEWTVGNELVYNVFHRRELFIDLVAGIRYQSVSTDNETSGTRGEANYWVPYGGLRLNRATNLATTSGSLLLVSYNTDAERQDIEGLGRSEPSNDPLVLQFEVSQSAYLEPLLDPQAFASGRSTLAHEVFVAVRGQYAFDYRLFPQAEDVAGGFYSVRGYPESIVAGDSVVIGTAEYRFHFPRILPVQADPSKTPFLWDKSFRFSPAQTYGRPDWDLIARGFIDVAEVINNRRAAFEENHCLVGAGVGLELQYKQNFNVRVDWGAALTDVPGEVKVGHNRFHISATLLY